MIGDRWAEDFPAALATLACRGPDAEGTWHDADAHLGHRRLSVIDLAASHQPMHSVDGRFHLIYNGEIYNYRALRDELRAAGATFATEGDTEVLLQGYAHWGADVLSRLDGMFAFAVWDSAERVVFAARDRMGVKPLFYSTVEGLVVASTVAPFSGLRGFPRKLNYAALRDYLACGTIFAPMSVLRDVHCLPPAGALTWRAASGECEVRRYWDIPPATDAPMPLEELVEATDAALRQSVERQLVSDVPLGAFLSGGVDSSLLVHYMAEASSRPVRTFTVRFPQARGYDESAYAQAVADRLGCVHTTIDARDLDAAAFDQAISHLDQPLADPAYLPTLALAACTRRHVTVAISGDGGDELFGGYPRFVDHAASYPRKPGQAMLRRAIDAGLAPGALQRRALWGADRVLWDRIRLGPYASGRKAMRRLLTREAYEACEADDVLATWRGQLRRFAGPAGKVTSDVLMRADVWTYLSDNCLMKTDRASMAHSLEVRVPLLGNPVVDLVLPQPGELKLAEGLKTVLNRLAARHLPSEVWNRPKHGFSVPLRHQFQHHWRPRCEHLVRRAAELAPFFDSQAVRRQWHRAVNQGRDLRTAFAVLSLLRWLETHPVDA